MLRPLAMCVLLACGSAARADGDVPPQPPSGTPMSAPSSPAADAGAGAAKKGGEADYRIDSGSEEISGDPAAIQQTSYDNWKKACAEWKTDMREMNGKTLITLNCGTPHVSREKGMLMSHVSTGTYKIKIRMRETQAE